MRSRLSFHPLATGALAIAVIASFTAGPLITATAPASPTAVACWRLLLAALALAPVGGRLALRSAVGSGWRARAVTAGAGAALAAHFYLWIASLRLTAIAPAVTLVNAAPLPLMCVEYALLGERPRPGQWSGAAVSLAGMALLGWGDWAADRGAIAGDALALGGAVAYAGYLVAGRAARRSLDAVPYNFTVFSVAAAALGTVALIGGAPLAGFPSRVWLLLGALAALPTLLGHALANFSLAHLSATAVALAYLLEPVGASLLGYLWLHQAPTWTQVTGSAVTLVGLAVYVAAAAAPSRLASPRPAEP